MQTTEEYLILVDETDKVLGRMEKMEAHRRGILHRAFSVFIFNSKGDLLLQKRAEDKYHSAGLWTNTCCSHPGYGEETDIAAKRRLHEEMGMHCHLEHGFSFIYKYSFENGLTENEYDHVYFGVSDEQVFPNAKEVQDWKYVSVEFLQEDLKLNPQNYTEWLKICFGKVITHLRSGRLPFVA